MPELPEVQTVVNDLNQKIVGFKIVDFDSDWKKAIKGEFNNFKEGVTGEKVERVERRAKYILVILCNRKVIALHLRMTGQLLVNFESIKKKTDKKYIHHWWTLLKRKQRASLDFKDVRKFATIQLFESKGHFEVSLNLGIEPLSRGFNAKKLQRLIGRSQRMIREILLDQGVIVGIGNIYISEILFDARISPKKIGKDLSGEDVIKLVASIKKILKEAIKSRGTTFSDYRDSSGEAGSFQKLLKVYNREGKHCKRASCDDLIQRETLKQRSSFWCEECQN